jgi:hypothetical protein
MSTDFVPIFRAGVRLRAPSQNRVHNSACQTLQFVRGGLNLPGGVKAGAHDKTSTLEVQILEGCKDNLDR